MRTTQTSHLKENEMNIEQALNAADESEAEGLRGLYPTAAQVLGAEVRELPVVGSPTQKGSLGAVDSWLLRGSGAMKTCCVDLP